MAARDARQPNPQDSASGDQDVARETPMPSAADTRQHSRGADPDAGAGGASLQSAEVVAASQAEVDSEAERGGIDSRRRGWFWHWNNVVTQYAPLIGLKGVGLLNSYTVWTDRREESPHRGYAFPGQQSEAAFYGEERSELITINKILVALDLIEIRKEMILRVDDRGRQWRVPHNLYRVRDRPEGVNLRAVDVLGVATLAKDDTAVFRYVRRVFSPRFKPIDRDNVWHLILEELVSNPLWQELQERTRALEERASARTRAGHRRRTATNQAQCDQPDLSMEANDAVLTTGQLQVPVLRSGEQAQSDGAEAATIAALANSGLAPVPTVVAPSSNGSEVVVDESNSGLGPHSASDVALANNGYATAVGQSNTTYHQLEPTTTTTTTSLDEHVDERRSLGERGAQDSDSPTSAPIDSAVGAQASAASRPRKRQRANQIRSDDQQHITTGATTGVQPVDAATGSPEHQGNGGQQDGTGAGVATSPAFGSVALMGGAGTVREDAGSGDRRADGATPRSSAGEWRLADAAAPEDGRNGPLGDSSPLVVSVFEAANDRRSTPLERILLAELERDADPPARAAGATGSDWVAAALREAVSAGSAFVAPKRIREIINRWATSGDGPAAAGRPQTAPMATPAHVTQPATMPEVRLPGGARGASVWSAVLDDLATALDRDTFERLLVGSNITRYWRGTVDIEVSASDAAEKLSTGYRGLVERHLNARLRKPVMVAFHPVEIAERPVAPESSVTTLVATPPAIVISRSDVEQGRQVWHVILGDLASLLPVGDVERLSGVIPLGEDASGTMLLGTSSPVARRLIEGRYRFDIERSLTTLLGHQVVICAVDSDVWALAPDD